MSDKVRMMTDAEAYSLVIFEGTAEDGCVAETRAGIDPGIGRIKQLNAALEIVANSVGNAGNINRTLAFALYSLSFHLSSTLERWTHCSWIDEYTNTLELIEGIFDPSI